MCPFFAYIKTMQCTENFLLAKSNFFSVFIIEFQNTKIIHDLAKPIKTLYLYFNSENKYCFYQIVNLY